MSFGGRVEIGKTRSCGCSAQDIGHQSRGNCLRQSGAADGILLASDLVTVQSIIRGFKGGRPINRAWTSRRRLRWSAGRGGVVWAGAGSALALGSIIVREREMTDALSPPSLLARKPSRPPTDARRGQRWL